MSRHRNVRSMNYSDEYDGYDDVYGHSVEDDYCISPSDEAQFMYDRTRQPQMSAFFNDQDNITEEDENTDVTQSRRYSESHKHPTLSDIDEAKLRSCIEEIRNVLGDTVSEQIIVETVIKYDFNVNKSLDFILSNAVSPEKFSSDQPKLQRVRRERERDSISSDSYILNIMRDENIRQLKEDVESLVLSSTREYSSEVDIQKSHNHNVHNTETRNIPYDAFYVQEKEHSIYNFHSSSHVDKGREATENIPNLHRNINADEEQNYSIDHYSFLMPKNETCSGSFFENKNLKKTDHSLKGSGGSLSEIHIPESSCNKLNFLLKDVYSESVMNTSCFDPLSKQCKILNRPHGCVPSNKNLMSESEGDRLYSDHSTSSDEESSPLALLGKRHVQASQTTKEESCLCKSECKCDKLKSETRLPNFCKDDVVVPSLCKTFENIKLGKGKSSDINSTNLLEAMQSNISVMSDSDISLSQSDLDKCNINICSVSSTTKSNAIRNYKSEDNLKEDETKDLDADDLIDDQLHLLGRTLNDLDLSKNPFSEHDSKNTFKSSFSDLASNHLTRSASCFVNSESGTVDKKTLYSMDTSISKSMPSRFVIPFLNPADCSEGEKIVTDSDALMDIEAASNSEHPSIHTDEWIIDLSNAICEPDLNTSNTFVTDKSTPTTVSSLVSTSVASTSTAPVTTFSNKSCSTTTITTPTIITTASNVNITNPFTFVSSVTSAAATTAAKNINKNKINRNNNISACTKNISNVEVQKSFDVNIQDLTSCDPCALDISEILKRKFTCSKKRSSSFGYVLCRQWRQMSVPYIPPRRHSNVLFKSKVIHFDFSTSSPDDQVFIRRS